MNAGCYKIVFSKRLGALVAVGEHTSGQGKAAGTGIRSAASSSHLSAWGHGFVGSLKMGVIAAALTLISTGTSTAAGLAPTALPTGAAVNAGNVAISTQGAAMTIQQTSDKASVNWNAFNIGSGASVNVQQNSVNSVLLNRVVGNDPSQILGKLTANGQVVLVNPNGIVFGKDGSVAASAFTASTFGISEQDFANGKYHYTRNSSTAAVTVEHGATLSATAPGGYVAVIGASVDNQGTISTQGGSVLMVAGEKAALPEALTHNVSVPLSGKVRLELAPSAINASVTNSGTITTEGGQVLMQAAALSDAVASITHTGVIDTTGTQGGAVTLQADQGNIQVSGSVKANSTGAGNAGGDVMMGRDVATGVLAKTTDVSGAKLESVKGFVETSGDFLKTDQVSVKAREWLLDPTNITIAANGTTTNGTAYTSNYTAAADSVILASDINASLNNGTSVTLTTSAAGSSTGNIAINESIRKTGGGDATLTLQAHANINVATNKTITSTIGKLNLVFNSDSDATNGGGIVFNTGSGITSNGGNITLGGSTALNGAGFAIADGVSTLQGISLNSTIINAGGGNIAIKGKTAVTNYQANLSPVAGIYMTGGSITTTGSGTIDLSGQNQNTDTQSKGIELASGTITGGSTGAVTIVGDSRAVGVVTPSTSSYIRGALINNTITSTGGNLNITGYGGSGAQYDYGVDIGGSVMAVGSGAINITGTAGAGGSGGNVGVNTSGSGTISSVDGAIAITGTGGIGNGSVIRDHGVQIGGANAVKSTGTGNITVTGIVTNSDNAYSDGVLVAGGGLSTNTGNIKLDGTALVNYQKAVDITAAVRSTSGNIYIRSPGANITTTSTGILSANNISIDNSNGTLDANTGVITPGTAGAGFATNVGSCGIDISGSITAVNNLNIYGNHTSSYTGVAISGATTTVSGKNVTLYGKSNSGNGVLLSGATLSGQYLNATGATNTGTAGFAWQGGTINTTGTTGASTASMVKGISAASTTASNGYGALMMFADGSANAANGTTLTLAGEATTLTTGQNTKERGILVQGARTLTMSGDITLDGSSKSSEGIAFGGTVNMSTVTGVTNKLTLKGTTAASSNSALNGVNFSGAINGNAATSSINLIGEAKNLSGTNYDTAVSITGTISGNAANINVQALSNGKITGTGAIGDTTNKNASVTFTQNGTSTYSGAINAANFTKAGAGSLTLDSWNLATPVATNISNAYTIKGGGLSLKPGSTFAWLAPVSVNVENASSFSLDANSSSRWNNTAFNFTGGLGGGSMNLAGNPIGAGSTTNTFSTSGGATNTITGGLNANGANVNFNLTAATSGTTLLDGSFAAIAFTQNPQGGYGLGSGSGAAGTVNVAGGGNLLFKDVVKTTNFNINAGAVQLGDGSAATSAATADLQATNVSIASSAKLIFNRAEAYTNASVITGVGSFIQAGAGTLTLTGNSSAFAGATTVNAGKTLAIGTGGSLGVAGSTVSLVDNASQLHFTGASGVSYVGSTIIGAGKVTQSGAGTTILLADNSYTGTTTVSGGTLQVGNAGTTGTLGVGDVTLSNNANLNYVRGAATTIANNISGAGNVSASITGTTSDLAVNHTITLTGGTVNLNADRNLSVTQAISTTNGTDSAVMLVAGKPASAGTATGGDVMVSGSGSVTAGTNGRVTYMTGSLAGSAGVGTTPGNNRYNSDEVTTNYTTALGSGAYTIYRERPLVTVQINNASKTYDGLTFTGGSLSSALTSGSLIGSDTFAALTANATYGGSSQGAKNVSATPYVISASDGGGKSALGYGMTYTSGALTISKANLVLSGTRVYDASKTFAGQYLSATGVAGETFTVTGIGDASNLTSKNVQTAQALSSVTGLSLGASANGGLSDNYNALSTAASSVSVTAKAATITGTATNTTYNGGTQNQQAETSNGFIAGDAIIITGQASGKNVGTYASSLAVSGNDANNYNVTINNANLVVAKANLVLSGTRVYDASTTFSGQHLTAMGVAGETFTVTGLGDASNLNHKNVQTAQALSSVTGLSLGSSTNGGLSDNYNTLSTTASSVSVTAKAATVTGITASNKTYDGNTSATVSTSATIFSGQIAGDKLTISSSGTFSDKNAATGKTVALANVLGGADLANYTITDQASTKADIAKKDASITGSTTNTTYNGTTQTQASAVLAGFVDSDLLAGSVAATGLASGRNAGTYTSNLSATGSDVSNYNISVTNKDLFIAKKDASITGSTTNTTYNGTTQIQAAAVLAGFVDSDLLTGSVAATGLASGRNAGTYTSNLSATGSDVGNYNIAVTNKDLVIAKKDASITGSTTNTTYNGTTQTQAPAVLAGFVDADLLTGSVAATGLASGRNAGTYTSNLSATGSDVGNYNISVTNKDLVIAKKDASITGSTTNTTYNGTTQTQAPAILAGFVDADLLTGSVAATGLASGRNAGTYTSNLSATGSDVGNYNIAVTNKDLVIAKKAISLSGITAANKTYDGTNSAVITAGAIATGVGTETLAISGTGTFSDKNAADGKTVTVADITTLTKTNATGDWRNYNLTSTGSATTTANINKKDVTLDSISAASKVYDGTDAADITTGTISGTVGSETLTMSGKGKFSSSAPGTNKLVTVADVKTLNKTNGTGDWNNYNLSTTGSKTTTATITAVPPAPPAPSPSSTSSSSAAARVKIPLGSGNPFQLASVDNLLPDTCSANNLESCFCEASTVNSEISICYEK